MIEKKEFDIDKIKVELLKIAKSSCRRCYGQGYIGYNNTTDRLVVCRCTAKKIQKYRIEKAAAEAERRRNARHGKTIQKESGSIPESDGKNNGQRNQKTTRNLEERKEIGYSRPESTRPDGVEDMVSPRADSETGQADVSGGIRPDRRDSINAGENV